MKTGNSGAKIQHARKTKQYSFHMQLNVLDFLGLERFTGIKVSINATGKRINVSEK